MEKKIIDVCCGPKMFWFDKHNPLLLITYDYNMKTWDIGLRNPIGLENPKVESPSLIDTAYNMLVWMAENNLIQKSGKN